MESTDSGLGVPIRHEEPEWCEFRRVEHGRMFCSVAVRGDARGTDEVYNDTCLACPMNRIRRRHPCGHLDPGLQLTSHRERTSIDKVHLACKVKLVRLPSDAAECDQKCEYFRQVEIPSAPAQDER